jgi:dihydrofolate reductase
MGKLVVTEFISLDGVVGEPPAWAFDFSRGDAGDQFKADELKAAEVQLLGRITYQGFAKAWPTMPDTGWFGEKMNGMPKYVVSTTLSDADADWNNSTVIRDNVAGEVTKLKEKVAGDILVAGSAQLVRSLAEHDLVDEYRLMLYPIVVGTGVRLFDGGMSRQKLRLVDTKPVGPDGILILTYQPAG